MAFRLTPKADEDVVAIYVQSIERFGLAQAERYRDDLVTCFDLLALQPQMARQRFEFDPPIRAHSHGSHVVAYVERDGDILILRVFHARQDWARLI